MEYEIMKRTGIQQCYFMSIILLFVGAKNLALFLLAARINLLKRAAFENAQSDRMFCSLEYCNIAINHCNVHWLIAPTKLQPQLAKQPHLARQVVSQVACF